MKWPFKLYPMKGEQYLLGLALAQRLLSSVDSSAIHSCREWLAFNVACIWGHQSLLDAKVLWDSTAYSNALLSVSVSYLCSQLCVNLALKIDYLVDAMDLKEVQGRQGLTCCLHLSWYMHGLWPQNCRTYLVVPFHTSHVVTAWCWRRGPRGLHHRRAALPWL